MKIISICLFLSIFCVSAFAGQLSEIILADGTTIYGEIVSMSNGIYKVKTRSLGSIEIRESEVRLVQKRGTSVKAPAPVQKEIDKASAASQIQELQKTMMGSEDIMKLIFSLQSDPKVQKLLADPAFMNAVTSGDISTIMSDPRLQDILNNPTVQEIRKKVDK